MNEPKWEIIQDKSKDHWLELKDPEGWYSAVAKWDGCIDFYRYFNTPMGIDPKNDDEEACYMHICGIDEMIARLQALKRIAARWFVEHDQHEYWHEETVDGTVQTVEATSERMMVEYQADLKYLEEK